MCSIRGIASKNATSPAGKIRTVVQCICNAGLQLTIEKCDFGVSQVHFLGRSFSSDGVSPQTHKIQKFPKNDIPQIEKSFAVVSGVREILQQLHSQNGWKAQPILWTLKSRGVVRVWANQVGGEGPHVLRKAIASRLEPRAEKGPPPKPRALRWRNNDSGDVILDSDWLKTGLTYYSILIGCRKFWARAECVLQR